MTTRMVRYRAWLLSLVLGALGCGDCGACGESGAPAATTEAPLAAEEPSPAEAEPTPEPAARPPEEPPEGWSKVRLEDRAPVCVFASHEERHHAQSLEDVRPQTLRAKTRLWFGAFAPFCVHESCDQVPSLQCWVDREGDVLELHSKYTGQRRDDADCATECRPINAACPTPELARGKYTVRYGERSFELRVPGVMKQPCLPLD